MYMTSAGNNAKAESAKRVITDSIIGLVIALSAYLLLYVINPDLVKISVTLKKIGGSGTSTPSGATSEGGGGGASTANCNDLKNSSLTDSLNSADNGVPPALLAAFMKRECPAAMSNPNACGSGNFAGAGGAMQFMQETWDDPRYKCSGSRYNRQDALNCAAKKISIDSGGDYSEAGIRKAAEKYCGECYNVKMCGGDYCTGIMNNYNVYKNCSS